MENLLFIIMGALLLIILALAVKIYLLHKSTQEIAEVFHNRLTTDTNTLIDISSRDIYIRKLASEINEQLRLLRKERRRYQQGDLELKEAITNISHDLRTPLTAIIGYLDLLDREEKSEIIQRYILQIRNRSNALKNLTEELFLYSLVNSERELKLEKIDAVRALEESLLSFYGVMREKNIQPVLRLPEKPVWRNLDTAAINRIFSNVISNALKYSDGDLSIFMDECGHVVFENTAKKLNAITVGRLFDRFYTVESGNNSTGLGLSIARILTERMGGEIEARYEAEKLYIEITFKS